MSVKGNISGQLKPVYSSHSGLETMSGKRRPDIERPTFNVQSALTGIFKGMKSATGEDYALKVLQHVTTENECRLCLTVVKSLCTDDEGKLNKKEYCNALQTVLDDILFTIKELETSIEYFRANGNSDIIPGYEKSAEIYKTNAEIIDNELKKYK